MRTIFICYDYGYYSSLARAFRVWFALYRVYLIRHKLDRSPFIPKLKYQGIIVCLVLRKVCGSFTYFCLECGMYGCFTVNLNQIVVIS